MFRFYTFFFLFQDFRLALFLFGVLLAAVKCAEVDDSIHIPGENINEKIKVLKDRVIYHIPKHVKKDKNEDVVLEEITKVSLDNFAYSITLFHHDKCCHVEEKDEDEHKSSDMKKLLKKVHHHLPSNGVVKNKMFRRGSCEELFNEHPLLAKEVEEFCGDRKVFCDEKIDHLDSAEKAIEIAREAKGDARKRAVVREFLACDSASTMHIMTCPHTLLKAVCRFKTKSCVYSLNCPLDQASGYWSCAYSHDYAEVECCDYGCQR